MRGIAPTACEAPRLGQSATATAPCSACAQVAAWQPCAPPVDCKQPSSEMSEAQMSVAHASANAAQGAAHMVLASNVPLEMSCCMLHRVFGVCGPAPVPPALCNTCPPLPAQHCCPAPCRGTGRCVDLSSQPRVSDAIHWNFPHATFQLFGLRALWSGVSYQPWLQVRAHR